MMQNFHVHSDVVSLLFSPFSVVLDRSRYHHDIAQILLAIILTINHFLCGMKVSFCIRQAALQSSLWCDLKVENTLLTVKATRTVKHLFISLQPISKADCCERDGLME